MRHIGEHIRGLLAALCLFGAATAAWAQSDSVRPGPDAVRLKTFWRMGGDAQTTIGRYAGSLGDINRDGAADFCISREPRNPRHVDLTESMIFLGAEDSANVRKAQTVDGYYLTRGDFWGSGHPAVLLGDWKSFLGATTQWIRIHRTESDSIETPAALEFDTVLDSASVHYVMVTSAAAADLDRDGYDDLVLAVSYAHRNQAFDNTAEFWIYRGGPAFSLAAPAVVLRDTLAQTAGAQTRVFAGDLDGDAYAEIIARTRHIGFSRSLIWWGHSLIESFAEHPDRAQGCSIQFTVIDTDGDELADIAGDGYIFLSRRAQARSRSFIMPDADVHYVGGAGISVNLGPLNDSSRQYSVLGVTQFVSVSSWDRLLALSGGPNGLDLRYDASWMPAEQGAATGLKESFVPVGDVNGDGWHDALFADWQWGDYDMGYAAILLGGSYVPRDFPASATSARAESLPTGSLAILPNPSSGRVVAMWQLPGHESPSVLEIADALGRLTYRAPLAPGERSHRVDCSRLAPGAYFVMVRDRHGQPLVQSALLVQ